MIQNQAGFLTSDHDLPAPSHAFAQWLLRKSSPFTVTSSLEIYTPFPIIRIFPALSSLFNFYFLIILDAVEAVNKN